MLSSVLKSERAADVNVAIMRTFVAMRRALASIAPLLDRIEATDRRQIADQMRNDANQARNEERFKLILDAMQDKKFPPQKVFFDGQIYDAFEQMKKFIRMAKTELIIIDPYFDDSALQLVAQKRPGVSILVVKNKRKDLLHAVDVAQFNAQYNNTLTVKESIKFHDRFLIIDKSVLIHVGASLNHLGKKCFAFSSLDGIHVLDGSTSDIDALAKALLSDRAVPKEEVTDAYHIATAAICGMDVLLTWNCRHLANRFALPKTIAVVTKAGYRCPAIVTPENFMKEDLE